METESFTLTAGELLQTTPSRLVSALSEVPDTTTVIDTPRGTLTTHPVPGFPGEQYVPWGADDQLPFDIINLVGGDEVTSQNKLFNILTCYGAGLQLNDPATGQPTTLPAVRRWQVRQSLASFFLEQITDMKHFFFAVSVFILSRDGKQINRILHKDACYCRLGKADQTGRIRNVYYANWRDGQAHAGTVERIPLLDLRDPLGDLLQRMGREPLSDGRIHPAQRGRKFAMLVRFPTAGCQYYPFPYWAAIFRGGSYDEKRLISTGKRAKLRNHSDVKYLVEVEKDYWSKICREERINDPAERRRRVALEKEHIRDFVSGLENSGKVWISSYYCAPDGREVHDVKITRIDGGKEGGDWSEDVQAAANTVCYADNVHPNLVGAVPGKSQSNNSGSDKRELFVMKQALEIAFHDMLLQPLNVLCAFNGWDVVPSVPMIQLTTLDEHRDTKRVNPAQPSQS